MPSRAWKEKQFARGSAEERKWNRGETISTGIGQGQNNFTPMQLAHAIATIANDGVAFRPRLVRNVVSAGTGKVRVLADDPVRNQPTRLPLKVENIAVIKQALIGVTIEAGGTGVRAFAKAGYTSGGKTGTTQLYNLKGEKYTESKVAKHLRDHSWYIAYAPADKPTIALAVLAENAGFGSATAAPIARTVMDYYLLGKTPEPKKPKVIVDESKNGD